MGSRTDGVLVLSFGFLPNFKPKKIPYFIILLHIFAIITKLHKTSTKTQPCLRKQYKNQSIWNF